jgi:hypothetical protein
MYKHNLFEVEKLESAGSPLSQHEMETRQTQTKRTYDRAVAIGGRVNIEAGIRE